MMLCRLQSSLTSKTSSPFAQVSAVRFVVQPICAHIQKRTPIFKTTMEELRVDFVSRYKREAGTLWLQRKSRLETSGATLERPGWRFLGCLP